MSNKKKKKKNLAEQKAEKYLSYGTLIGLGVGSYLGKSGKLSKKHS